MENCWQLLEQQGERVECGSHNPEVAVIEVGTSIVASADSRSSLPLQRAVIVYADANSRFLVVAVGVRPSGDPTSPAQPETHQTQNVQKAHQASTPPRLATTNRTTHRHYPIP